MQRPPEHVQFDHEWHDRALSNIHPSMLICAVMLGCGALIVMVLLIRFLARLLGAAA